MKEASAEEGGLESHSVVARVGVRCLAQTAMRIPISAGSSLGQTGLG